MGILLYAVVMVLVLVILDLPSICMELREGKQKKRTKNRKPARQEKWEDHWTEEEKQIPDGSFTLEYHFQNRLETDLDQINADLAGYALEELELEQHSGYLATVTQTDAKTGKKAGMVWMTACCAAPRPSPVRAAITGSAP